MTNEASGSKIADNSTQDKETSTLTSDKRKDGANHSPSQLADFDTNHRVDHPLTRLLADFIHHVDDMRQAATISLPAISRHFEEKITACFEVFKPYAEKEKVEDGKGVTIKITLPDDMRLRVKVKAAINEFEHIRSTKMAKIVERSLFIGLFSEFDAFMGNMLKIIYKKQPALLKSIRREVSLTDLLEFDSLDAVKQDMLDKEIDSFRRDSYIEQFSALENKFSFKTLRKFPEWSEFVEISQRRNLMTHNGGVVTEQYISVCARERCELKRDCIVGSQLGIGRDYYFRACHVLSLVAFMLIYTLWRKVLPSETEDQNNSIQSEVFAALQKKDWSLAVRMGEFSLAEEMCKGAEDIDIRIRNINLAIAYKNADKKAEMMACLKSCDWTASIRDFKLAVEVLSDNFQSAADMMRQIGKSGELVRQDSYHDWPLFYGFVNHEELKVAYREIYGHDFDAKREDESDAVTVDASGDNGMPLIIEEKEKVDESVQESEHGNAVKKTRRQRKKVQE